MRYQTALLITLPFLAAARTDLTGCTSTVVGPVVTWYVPGTGELCEFLDCGGGRAPPKTTVPGCAQYSGTATYSPNYLPGYGPNAKPTASSQGGGGGVTLVSSLPGTTSVTGSVTSSVTVSTSSGGSQSLVSSTSTTTGAQSGTTSTASAATRSPGAASSVEMTMPSFILAFLAAIQLL